MNLSGHVELEDFVIIDGIVGVPQFVKIGQHVFITGGSNVRKNAPPFVKAAREPLSFIGVNTVDLRKRGFTTETGTSVKLVGF